MDPFAGDPGEGSFNLAEYLHMVHRHWRLVAVAVALCLIAFGIRYAITPREYRAQTQIQIERRSLTSLTTSQSGLNPWLEAYWSMDYYPTQYRLLQSRGLAERVVRNLRLAEDPDFNPGYQPPAAGAGGEAPTADDDQAVLGGLAMKLLGGLEINPVQGTQLVIIAYRSHSPRLAAEIANGVVDAYIEWGIETRAQSVDKASGFLGEQIETLKSEIAEREHSLEQLSRSSDLITLDADSNVAVDRLTALNQDYIEAKGERISKEARYNELLTASEESVADTLSAGLVSQLRSQLLSLEQEYSTKLNTFKPEWPAMVELKSRIEQQRQHLASVIDETVAKARDTARAEYQTALRREQALAQEYDRAKEENLEQSSAAVEYNNLLVEVSTRRALLNDLMRKQSETAVASRLQENRETNVSVVDRALTPGGPFRPSLRRELSLGLMLGLMLGVGLALLIEFLDRTLKSPEEAEKTLGLPTLAVIPDIDAATRGYGYGYGYGRGLKVSRRDRRGQGGDGGGGRGRVAIELLPHTRPRLAIAEAYRSLRTALLLSTAEELKVVALTSAVGGEGKSTTGTNLAVVMSQLGRRVLLMDCDLRKPRLHEIFQVSNRFGLVNLLTSGGKAEEVFLRTGVPNLYLLPSGPIPPNPAELLASDRMRDFLAHVRGGFDTVIIDTPPALAVTDATVVGSMADGVLLCLRAGKLPREEARSCRDSLQRAEVRILGTVLNRHRAKAGGYGKQYQAYAGYVEELPAEAERGSAA